jgi:hypothetical protein
VRDKKGGIKQKVTQGNDEISMGIWDGVMNECQQKGGFTPEEGRYQSARDKIWGFHETDQLQDHS